MLNDRRAVRFASRTSSVESGCDVVGPAPRPSVSNGESEMVSKYVGLGRIDCRDKDRALRRNLCIDAKVPDGL